MFKNQIYFWNSNTLKENIAMKINLKLIFKVSKISSEFIISTNKYI